MVENDSLPRVMICLARVDTGGAPEHAFQLMKALAGQVEFHVACPTDRPYFQRFMTLLGAERIIEIPHRRLSLSALTRMFRAVRERRIDIIHSHGKGGGVYGRLVALVSGRRVIYTSHGMNPVVKSGQWYRDSDVWLDMILGKITDATICVSEGEKAEIVGQHISKPDKITVIENGVPNGLQRNHVNTPDKPLNLVAVSRFDPQKNPAEMAKLVEILSCRDVPGGFHLTVLGEGTGKAEFERGLEAGRLAEFVTMAGAVSDVRKVFRQADMLVSTSVWEGMPLALLEAMSEGLPVVASDVVGNRDVVEDGKSGFLYPLGQPEYAADSILQLADASLRQRFGDAGRNLVAAKHSVAHMANQTLQVYQKVLQRRAIQQPGNGYRNNDDVGHQEVV
uniref:glycosyltransferase n=1 Tax=Pararhizobium sp. IMCC3301 TaxID=3067904 RepID=UPI00274220B9|nr:glycosyltransferase [Pararhizobium sp. IMCC3301]